MESVLQHKIIKFLTNFKQMRFSKRDVIIRGDDEPTGVYFITEGFVKMSSINEDGREIAINIFKPDTFFPTVWAIGNVKNTYFYRAMSPVKAYKVPREDLIEFLLSNPEVLLDLTSRVLIGIDSLLSNTKNMLNANSVKKVAIVIIMLTKRFGTVNENNEVEININMSHQDISHFAGIARETTSLALLDLKKKGLIKQVGKKIIIPSLAKLEEV